MLGKKKDVFFDTIERIADNLVDATERFNAGIKSKANGDTAAFAKMMKELEKTGDHFTHSIYAALNKTFITPIEREDILALASSLDDVLDNIEACASRFDMYEIDMSDEYFLYFSENIHRNGQEIQKAIRLLSAKKLLAIREHTIKINHLENEADDLLRKCIKDLFKTEKDPIELIKRKEVYEMLELATDSCEDVANTLDSIIMRNS